MIATPKLQIVVAAALIAAFTFISGCKKTPNWKHETYEEHAVKPQSGEVKIPSGLWTQVLAATAKPSSEKKPLDKNDEAHPETIFEPLKVYLYERTRGVLNSHAMSLSFSPGGGELDLKDVVDKTRGSFYVAFEFLPDVDGAETKVFFLSNSVVRKIGDETVGSGCDKYFDLTQTMASAMKADGFLVNTSDQRHVSALAGTYVFANSYDGKLHLASLVIRDDEHRALQCRR